MLSITRGTFSANLIAIPFSVLRSRADSARLPVLSAGTLRPHKVNGQGVFIGAENIYPP
jgi:hypothetical protein